MKPEIIYINRGGRELEKNPTRRDIDLLSRREFVRRSTLFLPMAFVAGAALAPIRAKAGSVIINRTIGGGSQNAVSMANATWARPVTMPAGWNKIRVGMRLHWTNTAGNLTGHPIFAMGLNSGTTNQYGDATCQNFGGLVFDSATWSWTNTGTTYYSMGAGVQLFRMRVGTTNTDVAATQSTTTYYNSGAGTSSADRQLYFCDITKGSPNYTFQQPFVDSGGGPVTDISAANFLLFMGQLAPVPGGNYAPAGPTGTLAINEVGNGTWNAINLYWNRVDVTAEICDVAVAVLA